MQKLVGSNLGYLSAFFMAIFSSSNFAVGQEVRTITGWGKHVTEQDSSVHVQKAYNRQGLIVEDNQPHIYCGASYVYNDEGKISEKELYCGESFGNGTTVHTYEPGKRCETEDASGYRRNTCYLLDKEEKPLKSIEEYIDYIGAENKFTTTEYFYEGGKLVKTQQKIKEVTDSTHKDFEFTGYREELSEIITTYTYEDFDSLGGVIVVDKTAGDTLEKTSFHYKPGTRAKIKEIKISEGFIDYKKEWIYDDRGRVVEKVYFDYIRDDNSYFSVSRDRFIYEENALKLIKHSYKSSGFSWFEEKYFSGGLLIKTAQYNAQKELESTVNYYYTYW